MYNVGMLGCQDDSGTQDADSRICACSTKIKGLRAKSPETIVLRMRSSGGAVEWQILRIK